MWQHFECEGTQTMGTRLSVRLSWNTLTACEAVGPGRETRGAHSEVWSTRRARWRAREGGGAHLHRIPHDQLYQLGLLNAQLGARGLALAPVHRTATDAPNLVSWLGS